MLAGTRRLLLLALLLVAAVLLTAGCGPRIHLRDDHGRALHVHFKKQRISRQAVAQGAPAGLDSEEASLIHAGYRKEFAGGQAAAAGQSGRVLVLEEDKGGKKSE